MLACEKAGMVVSAEWLHVPPIGVQVECISYVGGRSSHSCEFL